VTAVIEQQLVVPSGLEQEGLGLLEDLWRRPLSEQGDVVAVEQAGIPVAQGGTQKGDVLDRAA